MREHKIPYSMECSDRLSVANSDEGRIGRMTRHSSRQLVTLSSYPRTVALIPPGAIVYGVSCAVNAAVSDDGGDDTWSAQLIGGMDTSLWSRAPAAQNTKSDKLIQPDVGLWSRGRYFTSPQYLSHIDAAMFTPAADFSFIAWVKLRSVYGFPPVISKGWNDAVAAREYILFCNTDTFTWEFRLSSDGNVHTDATTPGTVAVDTWYMLYAFHEAGVEIGLEVNASGTDNAVAHATGLYDGASIFRVGSAELISAAARYIEGTIGPVWFYDRLLTPAERVTFYRGGIPATWASSLNAAWYMDEESGDAIDQLAATNLTDQGGVTAAEGPGTTDVLFIPNGGSFSAGVIEVVAYYEQLTSLADA